MLLLPPDYNFFLLKNILIAFVCLFILCVRVCAGGTAYMWPEESLQESSLLSHEMGSEDAMSPNFVVRA